MRDLNTNKQVMSRIAESLARPKIQQGFLVNPYIGYAGEILVQLTDPKRGTRGAVLKARIRPGVVLPTIDAGSPVTVQIRHGQAEILGLSSSGG